ncbi:MAG TPA: DUF748 domain-containing protein [Planctomycetota bacterium]|nr:DUF748 domain-containing protein [Planctomycetota bacterium]
MNPLRWVRWKVVGALVVIAILVRLLGLTTVALARINSAGKESRAAKWSISDLALGILGGNAALSDLFVATPRKGPGEAGHAEDDVLSASLARLDLSVTDLLRRRYVVDEILIEGPKLTVTRREDGTVNIEDLGEGPPPEPPPRGEEPRDWLETIKKWYERIQKVRERLPESRKKEKEPGSGVDASRGVTYPFEGRPGVVVHEIVGSNFEIHFEDDASRSPIPPLKNGRIAISEVTSRPSVQEKPTTFSLSGEIAGSLLEVKGSLDLRGGALAFDLEADTGDLPVSLVEALVGPSLPVSFRSGTVRVRARKLSLAPGKLEVLPTLELKGISVDAKDPRGRIAGLDAAQFAAALNAASREIDSIVIDDLEITGSLASPSFKWGDALKTLVLSGGKEFLKRQADRGIEKGIEKAREALEKSPVGEILKDRVDGLKAEDILEKGFEIFDRGKKKEPADKKAK